MIRELFEEYKLARRLSLFWCLSLLTYVVLRVMDPEVMPLITTPVSSVVIAIIGLCATVTAFYERHRSQDKNRDV